jgi:hypothetical protein
MKRSPEQNNALHLYFERLAEALNGGGYEMKAVMKVKKIDVPWSKERIKENLWKPLEEAMLSKSSTTELSRGEVNEVYEVLNRWTAQNFGISVEFPSEETRENMQKM